MLPIIQEIIFPIMQYSEEDEDLYQNDTIEYIRRKFGVLNKFLFRRIAIDFRIFDLFCRYLR